jgi:soluble lytic murein transglycosylase
MPATARWVAKRVGMHDFHWSRVTEVDINARLGTYYLRQVLSELDSHPVLASAAYNAGPGRARNWRGDRPLEGHVGGNRTLPAPDRCRGDRFLDERQAAHA